MLSFAHGTERNQLNKRNTLEKGGLRLRDLETFSGSCRTAAPSTPQGSCAPPTCPELLVNWFSKPANLLEYTAFPFPVKGQLWCSPRPRPSKAVSTSLGHIPGVRTVEHTAVHSTAMTTAPFLILIQNGEFQINGLQYRRAAVVKRTGNFPVSCYWINTLIFVLHFTYISHTLGQKLFQMCLKDLGIRMSQIKFGCLRWTSRLGTLCSLLLPDLKNPEIKIILSSPNLRELLCLTIKNHDQN